jgi:two-component system LytT family sensor kinase
MTETVRLSDPDAATGTSPPGPGSPTPDVASGAAPGFRLEQLVAGRERRFWALQLLGWSGWAMAGSISWSSWNDSSLVPLIYALAATGGLLLTTALRYVYRAIWDQPLALRLVTAVAASLVVAAAWQIEKNVVLWQFMPEILDKDLEKLGDADWFDRATMYLYGTLASFYIILCWSGLYHATKYWQMLQREREKLLAVSAMAHQTQLKMLRYQLNPHFLFNTLNAISTLTLERENDLANRMVMRLSSFLRYSLDSDPMQKVDLASEMHALSLYLDIEQVRFEDRLRIEIDLDEGARRALIPSLLLQPLVENAIKYAIAPSEDGGTITIRARVIGAMLEIRVCDTGPGLAESAARNGTGQGRGVGLRNTQERLRALYGDQHAFRLENLEPHGLCVTLELPCEHAS